MLKILPHICIIAVLLLIFVDFTTQEDLFEGSVCQLHTGETGICKNAQNCKWLIQNLQKKKMKLGDIRRCLFTGLNDDVVCCGDEHPTKTAVENPTPCELGYIFDSYKCVPSDETASPIPVTEVNSISGAKISAACKKYSDVPRVIFESNIINGSPAQLAEYPHVVALGYSNNQGSYDFDCGGTLIADNWVVTAAHCIKDRRKPVVIRMGKVSLHSAEDDAVAVDRNIKRFMRHPQYSFSRKKNDIALIEFEGDVTFDNNVCPACIRTDVADVPESEELTIAGWGSIEPERTNRSEILLQARLSTVPLHKCNQTLVGYNELSNQPSLRGLSESQMCALNLQTRSDACQGDSGGPIFLYDRFTGVSTIVGIVSFGVSCGTELPGVYTRIASFSDWIERIIWP